MDKEKFFCRLIKKQIKTKHSINNSFINNSKYFELLEKNKKIERIINKVISSVDTKELFPFENFL